MKWVNIKVLTYYQELRSYAISWLFSAPWRKLVWRLGWLFLTQTRSFPQFPPWWLAPPFSWWPKPEKPWIFPLPHSDVSLMCLLHIFRSYPLLWALWAMLISHPKVLITASLPHSVLSPKSIQKQILWSPPTPIMSLWLNACHWFLTHCSVQDKFQTPWQDTLGLLPDDLSSSPTLFSFYPLALRVMLQPY